MAIFEDQFTDTDGVLLQSHTPDTGTSWTRLWGTTNTNLEINTNRVRSDGDLNSGSIYTADAAYPSADYDVTITDVGLVNLSGRPFYIFVRIQDQENMYAVYLNKGASLCRLYKKVSGTWTALGSAFSNPVDGSVCKLEIIGSSLKFYDDGVEVAGATDSDITAAGKAGLGAGGGAELVTAGDDGSTSNIFDAMTVNDLSAGGTEYTQDVAGTLTSAGIAVKQTGKNTAGTLTSSGIPVKQTGKQTAGTLTSAGVLTSLRTALASLAGTLTSGGTVTKQTGKGLSGTLTSAGTVVKSIGKMLAGVLSSIGILTDDSSTMPYDAIPDLVHLYEPARRGLTTYTGDLLRLRRDSDNAESDFPPDANGLLDTAAITTWLGGANPFIVTVYDQVGSDNPIQATAGKQPVFVASGQNSKPVISLSDDFLSVAFSAALSQPFTVYIAADTTANDDGADRYLIDGDDSSNRMGVGKWYTGTPDSRALSASLTLVIGATSLDFEIWTALFNSASSQLWINSSSIGTGNAGTGSPDGIAVGSVYTMTGGFWLGSIGMVAIADPSHDDTERGDMESAIRSFWLGSTEFLQSVAGVLTSAGAIVKQTGKGLAGAVTSSGDLIKQAGRGLAGTLETAGALVKQTAKALAGTLTSSGALATLLSGAATGIIHLTAKARDFSLTAQTRAFSLAAKVRDFALTLKDRD